MGSEIGLFHIVCCWLLVFPILEFSLHAFPLSFIAGICRMDWHKVVFNLQFNMLGPPQVYWGNHPLYLQDDHCSWVNCEFVRYQCTVNTEGAAQMVFCRRSSSSLSAFVQILFVALLTLLHVNDCLVNVWDLYVSWKWWPAAFSGHIYWNITERNNVRKLKKIANHQRPQH